ncbi:hypothetical protein L0128_00890 [candidate division KSB1 bacterium]|nr:hypothetical protein [candidate division KSB1 bacterium]
MPSQFKRVASKFTVFFFVIFSWQARANEPKFTLNFRSEAVIPGPQILLGEISQIEVPDLKIRKQLMRLPVTTAAVPGEAKEISLSLIKRRIQEAGFKLETISFKGPKSIRITTLPDDLIRLYIEDPMAKNTSCSVLTLMAYVKPGLPAGENGRRGFRAARTKPIQA